MSKKTDAKSKPTGDFSAALPDVGTLSFEAAYHELEQLVGQMEQGDLPLEQALALHARGQLLAAHCAQQLDHAELRIKQVGE